MSNKKKFLILVLVSILLLIAVGDRLLISFHSAGQSVPDPVIAEMISQIDESEIYKTAYSLQNFTTRRYGYSGNTEAATYLYSRLENISGVSVDYQGSYNNIIATLPGSSMTSNAIYIVGAHYDSTSTNQSYAPGATDNAGGVGIVLEFARIMSQYRFNHTIKFALWNAEENGMLGSSDYVKYAYNNNLNISLYMNFDSASYDPNGGLVLDLMYNDKSKWVSDIMTRYNTLYNVNLTLTYNVHTCGSDHRPFWEYGYPAAMTHAESHGPAHSQYDTVDKISILYAKRNGQLGLSVFARLATGPDITQEVSELPAFLVPLVLTITTLIAVTAIRKKTRMIKS